MSQRVFVRNLGGTPIVLDVAEAADVGGSAAPIGAEYLVGTTHATLTDERVVTNTATVTWDLTTPGQAKANAITAGTGDVTAASAFTDDNRIVRTDAPAPGKGVQQSSASIDDAGALTVLPTGLDYGLGVARTLTGTATAGQYYANIINVAADDADFSGAGPGGSYTLWVQRTFGGSAAKGSRVGIFGQVSSTAATSASNSTSQYVAVGGIAQAGAADAGTDLDAGAKGEFFGLNAVAETTSASAINLAGIVGAEVNTRLIAGSSARLNVGLQVVTVVGHAVAGDDLDTALRIAKQDTALGYSNGIVFDDLPTPGTAPITGSLIKTIGAWTIPNGVDLSSATITTAAFKSNGFLVNGSGAVTAASLDLTTPLAVADGGTGQSTEAEAVGELIQALSADATPDNAADYIATYDASADTGKKVLLSTVVREKLTAARTYYVRTDGSDSNTGLVDSAGGAFLTIQKAWNVILSDLDLGGQTVTVDIGDGTYTGGVIMAAPWTGGGTVTFQGNSGTPANVVISTTSANCFYNTGVLPGIVTIKDMKLQTTTGGSGINNLGLGTIYFSNIVFGACANNCVQAGSPAAQCKMTGNCSVVGNAQAFAAVTLGGYVEFIAFTLTLTGTPAFGTAFAFSNNVGVLISVAMTFSGSGTGKRYQVQQNAVIDTAASGGTYFPGNVAGTEDGFGKYF